MQITKFQSIMSKNKLLNKKYNDEITNKCNLS